MSEQQQPLNYARPIREQDESHPTAIPPSEFGNPFAKRPNDLASDDLRFWFIVFTIAIACAMFDFVSILIVFEAESTFLAGILMGAILAQLGWLGVVTSLCRSRLIIRWACSIAIGLGVATAIILSLLIADGPPNDPGEAFRFFFSFMPLLILSVQIPPFLLQCLLGLQFEPAVSVEASLTRAGQLSIGDLFMLTGIFALSLGAIRLMPNDGMDGRFLLVMVAGYSVTMMIYSSVAAIPSVLIAVRTNDLGAAIGYAAIHAVIVTLIPIAIMVVALVVQQQRGDAEMFTGIIALHFGLFGAMFLGFRILRAAGFRLILNRDRNVPP